MREFEKYLDKWGKQGGGRWAGGRVNPFWRSWAHILQRLAAPSGRCSIAGSPPELRKILEDPHASSSSSLSTPPSPFDPGIVGVAAAVRELEMESAGDGEGAFFGVPGWQGLALCAILGWILLSSASGLTRRIRTLVQPWVSRRVAAETPLVLAIQVTTILAPGASPPPPLLLPW